jgi:hypothetical protein
VGVAVSVIGVAGCGDESTSREELGRSAETLLNGDEFLYFRCGATAWGVDEGTRLKNTATSNVVSLTYQVTQPWMVSSYDQCTFTRTNQLNGWGTAPTSFGDPTPSVPLLAPGTDSLVSSSGNFRVRYAAVGTYTVTVDWNQRSFSITSGTSAQPPAPLPFWLGYCAESTCGGSPLVVHVCPESDPGCTPTRQTTVVPRVDGRQINQILFPLQLPEGFGANHVSGFGTVFPSLVISQSSPVILRSNVDLTLSNYNVTPVWGGTTALELVSQTLSSPEVVSTVYRHPTFLTSGEPSLLHERGRTIIAEESQLANIQPGQMNAFFLPSELATFGEGNFSDGNLNITINYGNPAFIDANGGVLNGAMPRFAHEYVHELFSEISSSYPGNNSCLNEGLADAFAFTAGFMPENQFGPLGVVGNDFDQGCAEVMSNFEIHDAGNCPLWQVRRLSELSTSFAAAMLHPQDVIDFDSCDLASSRTGNALIVLFSEAAGRDMTDAIDMAEIPNAGSLAAARTALGL